MTPSQDCAVGAATPTALNDAIIRLQSRCDDLARRLVTLQHNINAEPLPEMAPTKAPDGASMLNQAVAGLEAVNSAHVTVDRIGEELGFSP